MKGKSSIYNTSVFISTRPEISPPDLSGLEDQPVNHHAAVVPHQLSVAHLPLHLEGEQIRPQRPVGLNYDAAHL